MEGKELSGTIPMGAGEVKTMPTITWFNIPADDTNRAREFFEKLFDWRIEPFPGREQEGIFEISTGGIGGEIFPRDRPEEPITIYVDVPSVEEYAKRVVEFGGSLAVGKTAVPGLGYYVVCRDTERNMFGLWESDPKAR
jgi:uncharacterized protein